MKITRVAKRPLPLLMLPALFPSCFIPGATAAPQEQTMVVTAAPNDTVSELDTPAAVSVVSGSDLRDAAPAVNLSERLLGVPGLQIQNRQNFAQDLQVSIRGFGSRSTYGVRGIRMYVDGIPATMPDGQGQTSNIDINSIDSVEVLRGPFSALYGNASGGVIDVKTETGSQPPVLEAGSWYGSYGSWRYGLKASGATGDGSQPGDVDYTLSTTRFLTHGYRDHSAARKNLANAKLGVRIDEASKLTLLFNSVDINADDPGGLTNDEWRTSPRQAPRAQAFNTRKTIKQTQGGLRYERALSPDDDISLMMYAGQREMVQYQSIPMAPQRRSIYHAGGVIDLDRHYQGVDSRWTHRGALGSVPLSFTTGVNYENVIEKRKGFENFNLVNGSPHYGEKGNLRRHERNLMWNLDPYLQTHWQFTDQLSLDAGVRYSSIWFDSNDHYTRNGDDSYEASYHKWLPAGSLKYAVNDSWNLYLSAGRGFETPTMNERAYLSEEHVGINDLKPSTSDNLEIGSKTRIGNGLLTAALFQTDTDNEIVVDRSIGNGRSSYKNAGKTRRQGAELSFDQQFGYDWRLKAAWTWLDATYRTDVCDDGSCRGNRMPGIARNMGYASLGYEPESGWYAGGDVRYMSNMMADDRNTAKAPSYTVVGLNTGYKFRKDNWLLDVFGRVDNLFDKAYVGSVIVNESNGRYYEPAPGRNYGIGATLSWRFE